jgi:hypothetical protein
MRVVVALLLVLAAPQFASAETCGLGGPVFAIVPGTVKVTLRAGGTLTATLICVGRDTLVLVEGARLRQVPLPDVLKIVKPRDSLLNGFAIGAGLGLLFAAAGPGEAKYNPDYSGRKTLVHAVLTLGGIGAVIDAMKGSSWTIYTAPQHGQHAAGVVWRKRF